mmetsp:Transcript_12159/g.18769  ORF Transcript_12159/g.18769 Transcript_12159/m.18769 type:complete len:298 (-) Transcript_12159:214-1107(-)
MFVALQVEFTSLQLHDFHHGARESGQICGQSRLDAIRQLHGTTYYLVLTNSALRLSPRWRYNVPVNIFTTTTCSFFLSFFDFGAPFFLGMTSGSNPARASPDPLVVLRADAVASLFLPPFFFFISEEESLNSCENVTLFWLLAAPSLPLLLLESSSLLLLRFLDVVLEFSLESTLGVSLPLLRLFWLLADVEGSSSSSSLQPSLPLSLLLDVDGVAIGGIGDMARFACSSLVPNLGALLFIASMAVMTFPSCFSGISSSLRRRSMGETTQIGLASVLSDDFLLSLPVTMLSLYSYSM